MKKKQLVNTPTVMQMEAVECGAAALKIVLAYHGRIEPLEKLRVECGVSRDGSKASNVLRAARKYGFIAKGFKKEPEGLKKFTLPYIVFWNFNHFLVVEGYRKGRVYLNDPAAGRRSVPEAEFDESFTGVVLTFDPGPEFKKGGSKPGLYGPLKKRLSGSEMAVFYIILVGLAFVIPGLIIPTFSRVFIDNILLQQMDDWIRPLILGMAVAGILNGTLTWLQSHYLLRFQSKLALAGSSKFFWHIFRLPIDFFTQRAAGDISARVAINDKLAGLLTGQLAKTVIDVLMVGFYFILLIQYDVVLTFIGVFLSMLNLLALKYFARIRVDETRKVQQEQGKLSGVTMGGLQMIETLKATGAETDFFVKWAGHQAKVLNLTQNLSNFSLMTSIVPSLLSALNGIAILSIGGLRIMDGQLTIGMLIAFQGLMGHFMGPVMNLVGLAATIQNLEVDMNRLDDVLRYEVDKRVDYKVSKEDEKTTGSVLKLSGHLELNNISFGYSRLGPPLIKNFSLKLKPGTRVALVGSSGSGKSTISRIVAGLYEEWDGEILFDGKPRMKIPKYIINNSVAMVDQDIFLFEGTIRENITMWDNTIPMSNVIEAAKDACIHEDISARPNAYEGKVDEAGRNFSGGQRQRLEIARALALNASILILDEATSALDPKTESIIDDNLRRRGCTCLIVAHRLSTIRDADEIIVMHMGMVVQRGTHDEMKDAEGYYSTLIKAE